MKFKFLRELICTMFFIFVSNLSIYNLNKNISLIESALINSFAIFIILDISPSININPCFSLNKLIYKEIDIITFVEIVLGQFVGSIISIGLLGLIIKFEFKETKNFLGFINNENQNLYQIFQIEVFGGIILSFFYELTFRLIYNNKIKLKKKDNDKNELIQGEKNLDKILFPLTFSMIYFILHCTFIFSSSCGLNPFKYFITFFIHLYNKKNYIGFILGSVIGNILGKFIFESLFIGKKLTEEEKMNNYILNRIK